jgi:hypothetical protein
MGELRSQHMRPTKRRQTMDARGLSCPRGSGCRREARGYSMRVVDLVEYMATADKKAGVAV